MSALKKFIFNLLLLLPALGVANVKASHAYFVKHESQAQFISGDNREAAFLQPEQSHTLIANLKDGPTLTAKCADNFILPVRRIILKSNYSDVYAYYDCRASNIARLLFPFHFFW